MLPTHVFERGQKLIIVGPVAPVELASDEELAYDLSKFAPNELIGWLRGQYVEAERPNANGAEWAAGELSIKSLTPRLMPVNVMHDPDKNVGMIADTKLVTPQSDPKAPRARIDSVLGIWRHRFADVWDEAAANYKAGKLMQSMECLKEFYDCGECGTRFPALPGMAEKANWCACLRGETAAAKNAMPVRRLGNVTFTGTGLIFGTRGAKGAFDAAHLDIGFQEEVAEMHERAHREPVHRAQPRRRNTMDIEDTKYQSLVAAEAERDQLKAKLPDLEEKAAKVPELEQKLEQAETAKGAAERERDEAKAKVTEGEEKAREQELAKTRLEALSPKFKGALGDFTRGRLEEQAGKLSEKDWDARLQELEETAKVKRDEDGEGSGEGAGEGSGAVSREETAAARNGGGGGNGNGNGGAGATSRSAVVGGLARSFAPTRSGDAK